MSEATIVRQETLCRDHYRLTLVTPPLEGAHPGQFVHLGQPTEGTELRARPFLRRAFSIAGLRKGKAFSEIDLIYRVSGAGTKWMASFRPGERVSVLGPLGHGFEVRPTKPHAWLVAGGVGLPPLLWLAEWLQRSGKVTVAFFGARTRDVVPLHLQSAEALPHDSVVPTPAVEEFACVATPVILSTDDGSLGLRGTVAQALAAYRQSWNGDVTDVVVYGCGPEPMLAAVARWCRVQDIECQVCLEREMACGMGTCQSCVVRVHESGDQEGWRYALCCSEGPVFDARAVIWPEPAAGCHSSASRGTFPPVVTAAG